MDDFRSALQRSLPVAAGLISFAFPVTAHAAGDERLSLKSIAYVIAADDTSFSVSAAAYATYAGACLNADAFVPSVDEKGQSAVYVCDVRHQVVAEMESRKIVPESIGYRTERPERLVTAGRHLEP